MFLKAVKNDTVNLDDDTCVHRILLQKSSTSSLNLTGNVQPTYFYLYGFCLFFVYIEKSSKNG